uniref:CUE domain-containing protein n=1 Tax=Mycena chlorophos TaxID=658473 RepID=A0ABQ0LP37_MYCCL|nr:predicted protein [Mycena chlorophos]
MPSGLRYTDVDSSNLIAYLAHRDRRFNDRGSIATYRELGPNSAEKWSRKHPPHGWRYLYSTTASADAWIDRMATILDSEADQEQGMDDDEDDSAETRVEVETAITLLSAMFPGISREYFARAIDAKGGDLNLVFETLSGLFSVPKSEIGQELLEEGDEEDSTEGTSFSRWSFSTRTRRMPAESDEEGEDNGEDISEGHQAKRRGGSSSQRKRAKSTPSRPTASSSKPISRRVVSAPSKLESPPRGGSRSSAKPKSRTVYERAPAGWGADRGEMRRFASMKLNVVLGDKAKGKEKGKRNRPSSPEA